MPLPSKVSDAVRRLNPHLFEQPIATHAQVGSPMDEHGKAQVSTRLRQHEGDGMNKTERAFLAHLRVTYPNDTHRPHALSFRLANGANYRPDIISTIVVQPRTDGSEPVIQMTAWETKGFMREASAVRIKLAASLYPEIEFRLVTKKKLRDGGGWAIEPVLP